MLSTGRQAKFAALAHSLGRVYSRQGEFQIAPNFKKEGGYINKEEKILIFKKNILYFIKKNPPCFQFLTSRK